VRLAKLAPGTRLRLDIALKVPHPAALSAFVADVGNPGSRLFGHFLRRGQFASRFGPSPGTVAAVRSWLRADGLAPGRTSADRLLIPVRASAAAVQRAFGISLVSYRLPGGRIAFANSAAPAVPASVAPYVSGVLGLSDVYPARDALAAPPSKPVPAPAPHGHRPAHPDAGGPQPCSSVPAADRSHTVDVFAGRYWMTPLYKLHDFGTGVRVGVFEQEPNLTSDISAYEICFGIPATVSYLPVDGGAGSGAGSGEAALDIENIIGLSPGSSVDVYQGPDSTDADTADIYDAMVTGGDQVLYSSWGTCESQADPSLISAEQTIFAEAASAGQTVVAAAGDTGSTACYQDPSPNDSLGVRDPAGQPGVVAVGGTTFTSAADAVWNDSATSKGAGGGGDSSDWCMPAYQYQTKIPGLISPNSHVNSSCQADTGDQYMRQVPDVSAAASAESGYLTYFNGGWSVMSGTSGAGALWASAAALVDASPFCATWNSGHPGALPPGLYYIAGAFASYVYGAQPEGLDDVTSGTNAYAPSGYAGKLYPATKGYDLASGLGTPLLSGINRGRGSTFYPGLAALMCLVYGQNVTSASVTGVSPRFGPLDGKQTVTVTGSGFLPIAGADFAEMGTTNVAATCTSTTQCTFVSPKGATGTVDVRIDTEDLGPSKTVAADRYQYVRAPGISSLSPDSGPPHGGNAVTIRGSAFYGTVTIHFGKKLGTHVHIKSPRRLTVIVPRGSGTVKVTVTAAGGTSAAKTYSY
jgi:subtilase family serine protease